MSGSSVCSVTTGISLSARRQSGSYGQGFLRGIVLWGTEALIRALQKPAFCPDVEKIRKKA